jgi:nucleoside-diphosphate-sugar epimerase
LNACVAAKIKRIIHCSTVAVVGPTSEKNVTELTQCRPISSYGKTKLKIENIIIETGRNNFEVIVVRPTSVFGPNGAPLQKLTNNLIVSGAKLTNYLRSSLFGVRSMNLVSVANVVAAIEFLINERKKIYFEIFILSDDDSSLNNFIGVENYLINYFKLDGYSIPRMKLPLVFLELILRIMRRNSTNPKCIYLSNKLKNWGFNKPVKLDEALAEYALWYKSNKFLSR